MSLKQNNEAGQTVFVRILDENQQITPAKVRFTNVDGEFSINLPTSPVAVEAVKGYTYRFMTDTLQIHWIIQMQRWFEFPERTWYCGDVHVHHISPETALLEMQAEDLNVCNVLVSDFNYQNWSKP